MFYFNFHIVLTALDSFHIILHALVKFRIFLHVINKFPIVLRDLHNFVSLCVLLPVFGIDWLCLHNFETIWPFYLISRASMHIVSSLLKKVYSIFSCIYWCVCIANLSQISPKRARTSVQASSGLTFYRRSKFISSIAQDVFGTQFSLCHVLVKREVIFYDLFPDLAAIFTLRGSEPLLVELSPPPNFLV